MWGFPPRSGHLLLGVRAARPSVPARPALDGCASNDRDRSAAPRNLTAVTEPAASPPDPSPPRAGAVSEPAAPPPDRSLLRAAAASLALYVFITWPLVLHPTTRVVSNHGDGFFDMLLFWYARLGLMLAPRTDMLAYPDGVALGVEKLYWLVPCLSVPLQWALPLPAVFNLISAAFFVATATATFALARDEGLAPPAAFLAGALLVTSPAYLNEMSQGIPENMALQWLVLFILFGRRAARDSGAWSRAACGLFYVLTWLTSWYLGVIATVFLPWLPLRRLLPALLVAAPVVALALLPATTVSREGAFRYDSAALSQIATEDHPTRTPGAGGVDLLLATDQEWRVQGTERIVRNSSDFSSLLSRYRPWHMQDTLPGILVLALACAGVLRRSRETLPWALLALVFAVLSLGPALMWKGRPVIPTPLTFLYQGVTALSNLRPARFEIGLALALALLAARAVPRLRSRTAGLAVVGVLLGLQCFENNAVYQAHYRITLQSARVAGGYAALKQTGPMIEYPLFPHDISNGQHLYAQTVHHNPLFNYDYVTLANLRRLQTQAQNNSVIRLLLTGRGDVWKGDAETLAQQGFRSLVLHGRVEPPTTGRADALFETPLFETLRRVYGEPRALDGGLLVFDLTSPRDGATKANETLVWTWNWQPLGNAAPPITDAPLALATLPAAPAAKRELRGWLRGRGATVVVRRGAEEVARGAAVDDDWTWVRLALPGTDPLDVTIAPAAGGEARQCRFGVLTEGDKP